MQFTYPWPGVHNQQRNIPILTDDLLHAASQWTNIKARAVLGP